MNTARLSSARRWIDFLMPDALTMHPGWIRDLLGSDSGLLAKIMSSPTARLLLTRNIYRHHEMVVPARITLAANQQWLLLSHEAQRSLARRLGVEALREHICATVRGASVSALRAQLGDEHYERAIAGCGLHVEGLERAAFDEAVSRSELADYLVAVGAALLDTTTQPGDPFCRARMRFAFSPKCWLSRPRDIRVDAAELAQRIDNLTKA